MKFFISNKASSFERARVRRREVARVRYGSWCTIKGWNNKTCLFFSCLKLIHIFSHLILPCCYSFLFVFNTLFEIFYHKTWKASKEIFAINLFKEFARSQVTLSSVKNIYHHKKKSLTARRNLFFQSTQHFFLLLYLHHQFDNDADSSKQAALMTTTTQKFSHKRLW